MDLSDIRKVASLSRLALDDQELQEAGRQLTVILDYVRLLDEVDTTDVAPMSHPIRQRMFFDQTRSNRRCLVKPLYQMPRSPTVSSSSSQRFWMRRAVDSRHEPESLLRPSPWLSRRPSKIGG